VCQWHNFLSFIVYSNNSNFPNAGNDSLLFGERNKNCALRPDGIWHKLQINCFPAAALLAKNPLCKRDFSSAPPAAARPSTASPDLTV
jgi:hypothetical protein